MNHNKDLLLDIMYETYMLIFVKKNEQLWKWRTLIYRPNFCATNWFVMTAEYNDYDRRNF